MDHIFHLLGYGVLVTLVSMAFAVPPAAAKTFVYVSSAQDGVIDGYEMNMATGALVPISKTAAGKLVMPMAISPDRKHLYAVLRSEPFKVLTFAIDPKTGALAPKASAPLPDSMAYASTDATGRYLFTASYGGDKVAVSSVSDSGLADSPAFQVLPTGRNAHSILADRTNRFVYSANLGEDQILQYRFDAKTGKLTPNDPPLVKTRAHHGPRHLAFSGDNRFLYVLNELSGHVSQFSIDHERGTLAEVDSVASVPAEAGLEPGAPRGGVGPATPQQAGGAAKDDGKPKIWAADLGITPDGRFLYSTERTGSKIARFSIAPDTGKLTYVENYATETQPRGIRIDPTGKFLVASGEKSDRLSVYRIEPASGKLSDAGRYPVGAGANWVEIVTVQ